MKKLIYLLLLLPLGSRAQSWISGGTTQAIITGNKQIRWNFGTSGFVYGYTKGQVDSLKGTIVSGVSSVFGRTGAVTALSADYSSFYPLLNGTGATGTWGIGITGNAGTVTNGVYTTTFNGLGDARYPQLSGSYTNPSWIVSLPYIKITGTPSSLPPSGTAGGVLSGTYPNPGLAQNISMNGGTSNTWNANWTSIEYAPAFGNGFFARNNAATQIGMGINSYHATNGGNAWVNVVNGNSGNLVLSNTGLDYYFVNYKGAGTSNIGTSVARIDTLGNGIFNGTLKAQTPAGTPGTDSLVVKIGSTGKLGAIAAGGYIQNLYGLNTAQSNSKAHLSDSLITDGVAKSRYSRVDSVRINIANGFFAVLKQTQRAGTSVKLGLFQETESPNAISNHEIIQFKSGGGAVALNGPKNDSPGWLTSDHNYTSYPNSYYYFGGDSGKGYIGFGNSTNNNWLSVGKPVIQYDTIGNVSLSQNNTSFSLKTGGFINMPLTTPSSITAPATGISLFSNQGIGWKSSSNIVFQISTLGLTATRVLTAPDATTTILGTDNTAVVTNKDLTSGTNTFPTFNQNTTGQAGSVANSLTINNSGSGDASGTTFDGSVAKTISYNSIGAASANLSNVTLTGPVTNSGTTTSLGKNIALNGGTANSWNTNWNSIEYTPSFGNGFFARNNAGTQVGMGINSYHSTNGGNTWTNVVTGNSGNLLLSNTGLDYYTRGYAAAGAFGGGTAVFHVDTLGNSTFNGSLIANALSSATSSTNSFTVFGGSTKASGQFNTRLTNSALTSDIFRAYTDLIELVAPTTTYKGVSLSAAKGTYGSLEYMPKQHTDSLYAPLSTTPQIVAFANLTGQTSVGTIVSYTVGASGGTFKIDPYYIVTTTLVPTSTALKFQVTFTDQNNVSVTMPAQNAMSNTVGYMGSSAGSAVAGAVYNFPAIRAKAGTTITVSTINALTSGVFDVGATITQIN